MSYPKKHPIEVKTQDKDLKQSQKKDQLKSLLVNKFRGKYR